MNIFVKNVPMSEVKLQKGTLLNEKGQLIQKGYSTSLMLDYKREQVKAAAYRIKEWDYYLVHNHDYGVALTIADNSYIGALSISFLDFRDAGFITQTKVLPLTFGRMHMPESSAEGDIVIHKKGASFSFVHERGGRRLAVKYKAFEKGKDFECDIFLFDEPGDSMVIATPFREDPRAFYYNQKINCMKADGYFMIGHEKRTFSPSDAIGLLDWGRGVWTFKNTWYWGSASGYVNDVSFGFNIGYGFGDTSAASENMLFYKGIAHKLDQVTFHIPEKNGAEDYMSPWTFSSNDGRFELNFEPLLDRKDFVKIWKIKTDQHQVFGYFSGTVTLDNGEKIRIDKLLGFAEKVTNHW